LFIHLRDVKGLVQVIFNLENDAAGYAQATELREEFVIEVIGKVAPRASGTENPNLKTGKLEVIAETMTILAESKSLPFQISEKAMIFGDALRASPENVDEELRLKYRYLDLRRPSVQAHFLKRYEVVKCIREFLDGQGFLELETPVLTKSTPEGARDYLVPSRVHPGNFYALPQSPQLFKQLFMISGLNRYFQIVRCFRDEDLRPNRQPEFTQLDLEASFINEEFIYELLEELTVRMFAIGGIQLPRPFPRMEFAEAMHRYGSDRPDLRFGMAFEDVGDILENTRYSIFQRILRQQGHIKGFCVKGQADKLSKNVLQNEYSMKIAPRFGAKGMTWMKVVDGQLESNIAQFFNETELAALRHRFQAETGDVIILIADESLDLVNSVLGRLRRHLAERLEMIPADMFCPLWVTEFPLFEIEGPRIKSMHHPFTMPDRTDFDPANHKDLLSLKSRAYDLVMNGEELGGGSIRIHQMEIQRKIFQALELTPEEISAKFGFFLEALEYGAPPHGGLALGLDRVVAMILKLSSIRDVIAFPKNRSAICPLTGAPSLVSGEQLDELKLSATAIKEATDGATKKRGHEVKSKEKITNQQVRHVAKLARLQLTEAEIEAYKKDLNSILDYAEILAEVDTTHIEPMHHVLKMANVLRDDQPVSENLQPAILANAPQGENDFFKVPKILEG
jgi:aspartyl-tRNA synthetase